jgi:hypothetical protein
MENRKKRPALPGAPILFARPGLFLSCLFVCAIVLLGCAAPGEPVERKAPVPEAVTDLSAVQMGNDVILTFRLPKESTDRRPLKKPVGIEIFRDFLPTPGEGSAGPKGPAAPENPTLHLTIPPALVARYLEQGRVRFVDPLKAEDFSQHAGSDTVYIIRTRVSAKRASADSNPATLLIYPAPEPIEDVKAEITHLAIVLSWTPPQKTLVGPVPPIAGYHIYRAEVESAPPGTNAPENAELKLPLVKIGESASLAFQDTQFQFGKTYVYSVRSAAQYPGGTLESADSNFAVLTPRDIFPPVPPQGLVVVYVPAAGEIPAHLDLSWAISPETDISGYNVYRSETPGVSGTLLNSELLKTPSFRDKNVVIGRRYFYTVTAVDRSGNESPAGAAAPGGIPAESQPTP